MAETWWLQTFKVVQLRMVLQVGGVADDSGINGGVGLDSEQLEGRKGTSGEPSRTPQGTKAGEVWPLSLPSPLAVASLHQSLPAPSCARQSPRVTLRDTPAPSHLAGGSRPARAHTARGAGVGGRVQARQILFPGMWSQW